MPVQQVLEKKASEVEEVVHLLRKYKVVGMASLYKVRAAQLQELKKKLEDVHMRVIKNTLMKRAIEKCEDKPKLKELEKYLTGSNIFLFTNLNPFKLALTLEKSKVFTAAKAGDIAPSDIVVPSGNTGFPPGPVISQLNEVGLPTRIESGSVWITKDTVVAKKGEVISEKLASVLSKLGIKPIETGLMMRVVYADGLIIEDKDLNLDIEGVKKQLESAQSEAFKLSIGIAYPTRENIRALIQIAHLEAYALSIGAVIPTRETIREIIQRAYIEMLSLSSRLSSLEENIKQLEKG